MSEKKKLIKELVGFSIVGGASTVLNYGLFFLLFSIFGAFYIYASTVGYIAGIVFGYILNKKWTFEAKTQTADDWWRYALVYFISLCLGLLFLLILVDILGLNALISNILMIGLTTITNFLGVKFFAFNPKMITAKLGNILYDDRGFFRFSVLLHPLFWFGLIIKIVLGSLLASDYLTDLFIPFIDFWVESSFENPYQQFSEIHPEQFPYPPLMLLIMGVPRFLFGLVIDYGNESISILKLFTYRVPLLLADIVVLVVMARWLKYKKIQLIIWYWLNPVLLYITYIHGQLDVIPIAILFVSLHAFFRDKYLYSALLLGAAIATKFNIILVFPFWCVYLFKENKNVGLSSLYSSLVPLTVLAFNMPFIMDSAFLDMVYSNNEQQKILDIFFSFGSKLSLYIIPAILIILFIRSITLRRYSKDVFLMFLAFSFGIILFFIPPNPGWHYWSIPFFVYYFIKDNKSPKILLAMFLASYLIYFGVRPDSDYLEVFQLFNNTSQEGFLYNYLNNLADNGYLLVELSYTLMQTLLAVVVIWIYNQGFNKNRKYKLYTKSFLIGIGGDSGSGKSTLSELIKDVFHENNINIIRGDDMHKWERGHDKWDEYTHLDPRANLLHENQQQLDQLAFGNNVKRRHYDHSKGEFTEPLKTNPNKMIIFEGLHTFYLKSARETFDLKIFMEPDENLRYHWKIIRDMESRGYSKEKVLAQLQKREEDSEKYIRNQAKYADLRVQFKISDNNLDNIGSPVEDINLQLKLICSSRANIDELAHRLSWLKSLNIDLKYDSESNQYLLISGKAKKEKLLNILNEAVPELEEINWRKPNIEADLQGVLQIVVAYMVFGQIVKK